MLDAIGSPGSAPIWQFTELTGPTRRPLTLCVARPADPTAGTATSTNTGGMAPPPHHAEWAGSVFDLSVPDTLVAADGPVPANDDGAQFEHERQENHASSLFSEAELRTESGQNHCRWLGLNTSATAESAVARPDERGPRDRITACSRADACVCASEKSGSR